MLVQLGLVGIWHSSMNGIIKKVLRFIKLMTSLYENLLIATDNTKDITNEKFGTVTKVYGNLCSVIEEDNNLEHSNVPILNSLKVETKDKVILGFVENSIYNPIVLGTVGKERNNDTDLDINLEMDLLNNGYLRLNVDLIKGV